MGEFVFEREGAIATHATVRKSLVPCEIDLSSSFLILIDRPV